MRTSILFVTLSVVLMFLVATVGIDLCLSSVRGQPIDNPTLKDPRLKVELVAGHLNSPTTMAFLDNDHILVLEKNNGTVRMISNGVLLEKPILDVNVSTKFERGMDGIATWHDKEANSTYVYLYFTQAKSGDGKDICTNTTHCDPRYEPIGNRLYRYTLAENKSKLENPKLILALPASPGAVHNGGVILFDKRGNIFLTVGELGSRNTLMSNKRNGTAPDGRGGILVFDKDGNALSNQGILGPGDPLNKYYAYGIRNSFGIDIDPITGKLWDTENGPGFGDEINLVDAGFNSGWSKIQGIWKRENYFGGPLVKHPEHLLVNFSGNGKYSMPEFTWNQTVGPTAIRFLNSDKYGTEYKDDIFVGSNDNNGILYHFDLNRNRTGLDLKPPLDNKVANNFNETKDIIFGEGFGIISDLKVGPDGYLYVVALGKGSIYKIMPRNIS